MTRHTTRIKTITLVCALLAASCIRDPLWVEYGPLAAVNIVPDWGKAGGIPQGCETFVYDEAGVLAGTVLSKRTDTIRLELPPGRYRALTITYSESEYGSFSIRGKESLEGICAVCDKNTPSWKAAGVTKTVSNEPEWIAAGLTDEFRISEEEARSSLVPYGEYMKKVTEGQAGGFTVPTVRDVPVRIVNCISDFILELWIDDIRKVQGLRATVGGFSSGWALSKEKALDDTLSLSLDRWGSGGVTGRTPAMLQTESNCFGIPGRVPAADNAGTNMLDVFLLLGNGETTYRLNVDARPMIEVIPDRSWTFRDTLRVRIGGPGSPVVLPDVKYYDGSSAFDAWVDNWEDKGDIIIPF